MALDGIVLSNIVYELQTALLDGKIDKINQPEKDELIFSIRSNRTNYKLLMTAQATNPRVHFTEATKTNPLTPPALCMLFRKHLVGGKIIAIEQPNLDRVIQITIEHYDEMNDLARKYVILELMGRHSNIILTDENYMILESIRRVSSLMSSLREVFPGRTYLPPPSQVKSDIRTITDIHQFKAALDPKATIQDAFYKSFYGLSALIGETICLNAGILGATYVSELSPGDYDALYLEFSLLIQLLQNHDYSPVIYSGDEGYVDFHCMPIPMYSNLETTSYPDMSKVLDIFYLTKSNQLRMKQKSIDLRKLIQTLLDRNTKKLGILIKQFEDTKNKEQFKIKGELIQANLYQLEEGASSVSVFNYYTNEDEVINLKPNLTLIQNANVFFDKYQKKKRTEVAVTEQIAATKREIAHLESIQYSIENAELSTDIQTIRKELIDAGYIKFKSAGYDKRMKPSKPLHFLTKEGFHIYVGKNNEQNEFLSTKFASNSDWWFHTKEVPGSHVIVVTKGAELPDHVFEQAAALAAYYSKAKDSTKVTVDYVQKKFLKKPAGSPLGFVIYHTNYSLHITPSKNGLEEIDG